MENIRESIRKIEEATGKIVVSYDITATGPVNIQFLPYGMGDLVLDVGDMKIRLCRVVPAPVGGFTFARLLDESASPRVEKWLYKALDAAGGMINRSGHYPIIIPVPAWLEPEIAMATLGK